jgi:hypothetical protein
VNKEGALILEAGSEASPPYCFIITSSCAREIGKKRLEGKRIAESSSRLFK